MSTTAGKRAIDLGGKIAPPIFDVPLNDPPLDMNDPAIKKAFEAGRSAAQAVAAAQPIYHEIVVTLGATTVASQQPITYTVVTTGDISWGGWGDDSNTFANTFDYTLYTLATT